MSANKLCAEQNELQGELSDLRKEINKVMAKTVKAYPKLHKNNRTMECREVGDNSKKFDNVVDLLERKRQKNGSLINALESLSRNNSCSKKQDVIDSLTGLFTRNYLINCFDSKGKRTKRNNRPLSLLLIDIDTFRKYNHDFGHIAGDLLLKKFAEILRSVTRETDFVCRFGGDEFVVVLDNVHVEVALMVAERIRTAFKSRAFYPDDAKGADVSVTKSVSIGVCSVAGNEESLEGLIEKASVVMLRAKQNGGDEVRF